MTATTSIAARYRLRDVLGRGGVGVVWRAYDELLHREVAVKEVRFPPGLSEEERQALADRTLEEARQVAAIDIAAAVRVFDIVEQDGRPWIVMELVEGRTLTEVLGERHCLPSDEVARIGLCLLDALEAAHRCGVIHRDVKPSNVIIGPDGRIALTDFGIATVDDDGDTATGVAIGSPAYLAPERGRGDAARPESDLWSLGATLWTAVEGVPPFDGATPADVLRAVASGDVPRCSKCSGELATLLRALMAADPDDRPDPTTIREVLESVARESRLNEARPWPLDCYPDEPVAPSFDRTTMLPTPSGAGSTTPRWRTWQPLAALLVAMGVTAGVLTTVLGSGGAPSAGAAGPHGGHGTAALPDGWHRYTDPTNDWSIGVPGGWTTAPSEFGVRFTDPAGGRYVQVDVTTSTSQDAVSALAAQEDTFAAQHADYARLRLAPVDVAGVRDAADWEFTYVDQGAALHAVDRGMAVGSRWIAVFVQTHSDTWTASSGLRRQVLASFRP